MKLTKRRLVGGMTGIVGIGSISPVLAALEATPRQTEGPFYPRGKDLTADIDNDLVKIAGEVKQAGGEILHLEGTLTDRDGRPVAGSRIEIWQCDVNGRYLHGRDSSDHKPRDPAFQGFGATITDRAGRFTFRTIKPVSYPGRTPHIHAKFFDPASGDVLTTQLYVAGDPANARDGLFRRLSAAEKSSLTMKLQKNTQGEWRTVVAAVI